MGIKIRRLLAIDEGNIEQKLDNHIKYLPLNDKTKIDKEKGIQYDIWGVGWGQVLTEVFHIRYHPLINSDDIKKYKFPEVEDKLLTIMREIGEKERDNYFLLSLQDWTLFERLWLLKGFENTLMDLYSNEKEINYLLDGITEFHIEMSKRIIKLEIVDGLYTGDDFGTQRGMVMSPETWRKFFKERYKKIWRIYKDKNLPVFHHSCGNIIEIIPDLIEIGLDVITPVQPEAMDPEKLSEGFGEKLSFLGGISTQNVLPFGTPQDVRNEVIDRIRVLGRNNGYIISPSHEVTSDCKPENFRMLISTLGEYKRGEINTYKTD
jgi:uroporphyrinogen decarboxylase